MYSAIVLGTFHHCLKPDLFFHFFNFIFSCVYFSDRDRFQLGTLSHSLNIKATGYQELSDWPDVAPDQSVRNVEVIEQVRKLTSLAHTSPPLQFRCAKRKLFIISVDRMTHLTVSVWNTSIHHYSQTWFVWLQRLVD